MANSKLIALSVLFLMAFASIAFADVAISWRTDKASSSRVDYGERILSETVSDAALVTEHKVTITGLKPGTVYRYRIVSTDPEGNVSTSDDKTFVTRSLSERSPLITDIEAEGVVAAGTGQSGTGTPDPRIIKTEPPVERPLIERHGILLRRGKAQFDPAFTYAHVSANRIALNGTTILPVMVIGQISSQQLKKDIFIETLTARYGVLDNLQVELRVPFRYQYERNSDVNMSTETVNHAGGIGDIDGSVLTQLLYESDCIPDLIAGINVKSHTGRSPYGREIGIGTGHWGVKASLTAVKTSDPAILFGGVAYTWNKSRAFGGFGEVDPGDTFTYNLGFAFALNYQLGLNFSFEQSITPTMTMNGQTVPGSFTNAASFKSGASWTVSKNLSVDISVGIGLTTDSPDFTTEVKFPYTF